MPNPSMAYFSLSKSSQSDYIFTAWCELFILKAPETAGTCFSLRQSRETVDHL